jgi:diguanylate cyclase (GGDEF)-like protein/PAS domain S-box-containing protein
MATPSSDAGSRADAEAHATLTRILGAIEEYVYTGEFLPGDEYRVLFAGPCRERFLGMSVEQAAGAVWADYVHPDWIETFDAAHHGAHQTGRLDVEYQLVGADGRVRWVRDRGRMRVEDGRRYLDGSVLDVTAVHSAQLELEAARAEAQRLAQVDHLTGAANRRSLAGRLDGLGHAPVGVLTIDVDHFKQINDLYGHAAGDAVLVSLAARLRLSVRREDDVVRMGGEEFLLLLPGVLDETALLDIAESVRSDVAAKPVHAGGDEIAVTVSVGAAIADARTHDVEALLVAADRALYAAKRSGRNCVRLASADPGADPHAEAQSDAMRLAQAMATVAAAAEGMSDVHLLDVSLLAARVARRLGSSPSHVLRCRLAGLLHDVGKVRIPSAILTMPGPLDEDQRKLMREHSAHGEVLITAVPDLRPIAPIVRHHHERWDGSGYPDGLAGTAIPLEARIIAAVDAWSAMTTDRAYRAALPEAAALLELDRVAGSQLDPEVVGALRSVLARPREADAGASRA